MKTVGLNFHSSLFQLSEPRWKEELKAAGQAQAPLRLKAALLL